MNYEWLESFVCFSERLNFTHAAKELHISQPALHVQIRKLGEELGLALYERRGRRLYLTVEGERLASYGRAIRTQEQELLAELHKGPAGPIVLAAGQGAFLYLLGAAIRRFPKQTWPLELEPSSGPEALRKVRESRAHLAVLVSDEPLYDLEATTLRTVGQMVVLPSKHRLAGRSRLQVQDLDGEPLVLPPIDRAHRRMLEQAFATVGAALQVAVEASGWELMLRFTSDGMGLTIVNDICKVPRGCVGIPLRGLPSLDYRMVHKPTLGAGARKLADLIESSCKT